MLKHIDKEGTTIFFCKCDDDEKLQQQIIYFTENVERDAAMQRLPITFSQYLMESGIDNVLFNFYVGKLLWIYKI